MAGPSPASAPTAIWKRRDPKAAERIAVVYGDLAAGVRESPLATDLVVDPGGPEAEPAGVHRLGEHRSQQAHALFDAGPIGEDAHHGKITVVQVGQRNPTVVVFAPPRPAAPVGEYVGPQDEGRRVANLGEIARTRPNSRSPSKPAA